MNQKLWKVNVSVVEGPLDRLGLCPLNLNAEEVQTAGSQMWTSGPGLRWKQEEF